MGQDDRESVGGREENDRDRHTPDAEGARRRDIEMRKIRSWAYGRSFGGRAESRLNRGESFDHNLSLIHI